VVTPPPLLLQAFDGDIDRAVYHLNKLTNDVCQQLRATRKWPAMGAQKVQRIHPWSEPRTLREPGGHRVPSFRIGSRGIIAREHDQAARKEVRQFRHEHEEVRLARHGGGNPFQQFRCRTAQPVVVEPQTDFKGDVAAGAIFSEDCFTPFGICCLGEGR